MRGLLTAALADATLAGTILAGILAGASLAVTQAQAQSPVSGFSAGRPGQGGQQEKKPQYIPGAKAQEKVFPLGTTWTAVSLNGKAYNGGDRPSFIIDTQYRARGYGGCNTFAATAFPLRDQHLAVGPLAITKNPCDKGLAAAEQAFLTALRTAGAWDIVDSQLVIKSQAGELRFDRSL